MTTDVKALITRDSYEGLTDAEVRALVGEARAAGYEAGRVRGAAEAVDDVVRNPVMVEAYERARKASAEFEAMVRELTGEDHG